MSTRWGPVFTFSLARGAARSLYPLSVTLLVVTVVSKNHLLLKFKLHCRVSCKIILATGRPSGINQLRWNLLKFSAKSCRVLSFISSCFISCIDIAVLGSDSNLLENFPLTTNDNNAVRQNARIQYFQSWQTGVRTFAYHTIRRILNGFKSDLSASCKRNLLRAVFFPSSHYAFIPGDTRARAAVLPRGGAAARHRSLPSGPLDLRERGNVLHAAVARRALLPRLCRRGRPGDRAGMPDPDRPGRQRQSRCFVRREDILSPPWPQARNQEGIALPCKDVCPPPGNVLDTV